MKLAPNTPEKIRDYFRVKAKQLAAVASLPICDHSGLAGSHREQVQRIYLREILPKRFEIGRGMVYGVEHRSYEADIVVWDSIQYPSLPMADHSLYFAESVRADRKSTRLNSSHLGISYAVFCLKKKNR